jgi:hypothetical protein
MTPLPPVGASSVEGEIDHIWMLALESRGHFSPIAGWVSMCGSVETARYWAYSKSMTAGQKGSRAVLNHREGRAHALIELRGKDTSRVPISVLQLRR